jgi:hypothetical protein
MKRIDHQVQQDLAHLIEICVDQRHIIDTHRLNGNAMPSDAFLHHVQAVADDSPKVYRPPFDWAPPGKSQELVHNLRHPFDLSDDASKTFFVPVRLSFAASSVPHAPGSHSSACRSHAPSQMPASPVRPNGGLTELVLRIL